MLNNARVRQAMRGAIAAQANGPSGPQDALNKVAMEVGLKPGDVGMTLDKFAKKDAKMANQANQKKASTTNSMPSNIQSPNMGMRGQSSKSHK